MANTGRRSARSADGSEPVRSVALRILDAVLLDDGSSSVELERARVANVADRALLTELVLGTLRRLIELDGVIATVTTRAPRSIQPRVRNALRLGAYQLLFLDRIPPYAAVGATVEAAKLAQGPRVGPFINGVLRGLGRRPPDAALLEPRLPTFLADRWRRRFGDAATRALAEAAARSARVTLRVLERNTTIGAVRSELEAAGVTVRPGRYLEEALVVERGSPIGTAVLREGRAIVQDEAAQLVARLLSVAPRERILDLCAAPGGKSIAIADRSPGGHLIALDRRPARIGRLRANVRATGWHGIDIVVGDAERPPFLGPFEAVLLDAPCTSTGTIRRNPEVRYRVDSRRLELLRERNRRLSLAAAALLAPGGRLVYSTCSLEPEENEDVIDWLLAREPSLERVDLGPLLPAATQALIGSDGALRTQPVDPELDGFTAFVLTRRGAL